jgi:protein TonB
LAASALFHVAAVAAVARAARSVLWELRLPQGRNTVALAASISHPRTESESQVRIEPTPIAAAAEPPPRREAELPDPAKSQDAAARADERSPPPTVATRQTDHEQAAPPDRPEFAPTKKEAEAKLRPSDTAAHDPSVASPGSAASSGVRESRAPAVVFSVEPIYPPQALNAGIEGVVKVRIRVDATGKVVAASVEQSSGHAILDAAALGVLHRWRFSPPDGGQRVAAEFTHTFEFDHPAYRRR